MTAPLPPASERFICVKCAGVSGLHYLTCPTLRLPADVPLYDAEATR